MASSRALVFPMVRIKPVANAIGFLLIALDCDGVGRALPVMLLSRTFHYMGLGCLDRLAGAAFGFFKGALLVTLVILVTVAFFPNAHWLARGPFAPVIFRGLSFEHAHEPSPIWPNAFGWGSGRWKKSSRCGCTQVAPYSDLSTGHHSLGKYGKLVRTSRGGRETRTGQSGDANAFQRHPL
jgi:hypothetical protein